MNILVFTAAVAVILALGVWIGICISDKARQVDDDIRSLIFAQRFNDELDREADRWRR